MDHRKWRTLVAIGALVVLLGGAVGFSAATAAVALRPTPTPTASPTPSARPTPSPTPSPTPEPPRPQVAISHETCCDQTARYLDVAWSSDQPVHSAELDLRPQLSLRCSATVGDGGRDGRLGCDGLLAGDAWYTATLTVTTARGPYRSRWTFRTMGDRLEGVPWFTEFEDPIGPPLRCAAASVRMVQLFASGTDPMTADQILQGFRAFNRSNDPGLDPVAIATALKRLHDENDYHYYVFETRQEATEAAVYWLLRSGKPVVQITLAGQHAPLVTGFNGEFGTEYGDPTNRITEVIVQDPQRGDLRPETNRRPDIYRAATFRTGHPVGLDEWYRHEWWLGYGYWWNNRAGVPMDRNDDVYPAPHWAGNFVILVDDGDAEQPSELMGRVDFR